MELSEVVEVVEATLNQANKYLENGYQLLSISVVSDASVYPEGGQKGHYVRRRIRYALGRPLGVAHWEPPSNPA